MRRPADLARVPLLLAVEVGMVLGLHRLGQVPALRIGVRDPLGWIAVTPPGDALAAVARLVALGIAGWVLLSTVAYLAARASGVPPAVRTLARLTLPAVRRAVERSVAVGVLTGALVAPLPAGAQAPPIPPPPVDQPTHLAQPTQPTQPAQPAREDPLPDREHRIVPGDHLWGIAEGALTRTTGTEPEVPTVARYWLRVVEANRDRLRSGDPDLVYPGEIVRLPPVDGPRP